MIYSCRCHLDLNEAKKFFSFFFIIAQKKARKWKAFKGKITKHKREIFPANDFGYDLKSIVLCAHPKSGRTERKTKTDPTQMFFFLFFSLTNSRDGCEKLPELYFSFKNNFSFPLNTKESEFCLYFVMKRRKKTKQIFHFNKLAKKKGRRLRDNRS